jgi:outer membrane protein assembly factor BamB
VLELVDLNQKGGNKMKKILSIAAIFVIVLSTFSTLAPLITVEAKDKMYDWPMFHQNAANAGYSESLAPNTNNTEWIFSTGSTITSSAAVAYDMVYFEDHEGRVYALNASTGRLIWIYDTGGYIYSSPAIADGRLFITSYIFIGAGDKATLNLYALDALTGNHLWNISVSSPWGTYPSSPTVAYGYLFITLPQYGITCLSTATGEIVWNDTTAWAYYPAVADGKVIVFYHVNVYQSEVKALNAFDGSLIWVNYSSGDPTHGAAIANGKVFVASTSGRHYELHAHMQAFNLSNGNKLWDRDLGGIEYPGCFGSTPSVAYGLVYVSGAHDGKVYAFDENTGDTVWTTFINNRAHFASSPVVAEGKVFVGTTGMSGRIWSNPSFFAGKVYALNASTGDVIWTYQTGNRIHSSPAIAYGRLYVGSNDGKLYCFGPSVPPEPIALNVVQVKPNSIMLSWTASNDPSFSHYEIHMSTTPMITSLHLNETTILTKIAERTITTYNVTDLWSSTTYYFIIKVVNTDGLSSLIDLIVANEVNATTLQGTVIDDGANLIIPPKVKYWLCGVHSYTNSIQIYGNLYVVKYNGSHPTGTLKLQAPTIKVYEGGAIISDGAGYRGGEGGNGGDQCYPNEGGDGGLGGEGSGAGSPGSKGGSSHGDGGHGSGGGGGGGAASHGGSGGYGGKGGDCHPPQEYGGSGGNPGPVYGNISSYEMEMGSGGGGGGGGGHGGNAAWGAGCGDPGRNGMLGGAGGGAILLKGTTIIINGIVSANGENGGLGGAGGDSVFSEDRAGGGGGGGGGGSGGSILIDAEYFTLNGVIEAVGGKGGKGGIGGFGAQGSVDRCGRGETGSLGGGGRVKIFCMASKVTGRIDVGNGTIHGIPAYTSIYVKPYHMVTGIPIVPLYRDIWLLETFAVNVTVANVTNLFAYDFKLYWNTTLLDCTGVNITIPVEWETNFIIVKNETSEEIGRYWLAISALYPAPPLNGTINLVSLTFNVTYKGDIKAVYEKTFNTTLELRESLLLNYEILDIPHNLFDSTVRVRLQLIGDIWGLGQKPDGKVDMRDIAFAAKLFGSVKGDSRYDPRADITGETYLVPDGKIDMRDIALIARNFGKRLDP